MKKANWCQLAILFMGITCFVTGCGTSAKPTVTDEPPPVAHEEHAHPEEGPHLGHLIELGKEDYHAELTHDAASKTVTVYLLDGEAMSAVPIPNSEITLNLVVAGKPAQFKLAAKPQGSDPKGQASRFSLTDVALMEALETADTTGRLNVAIHGKEFAGTVQHMVHSGPMDK